MKEKVYVIIENVDSKEWGKFQTIPYWFETKEEAEELVSLSSHKNYLIETVSRSDWENGYEERLL